MPSCIFEDWLKAEVLGELLTAAMMAEVILAMNVVGEVVVALLGVLEVGEAFQGYRRAIEHYNLQMPPSTSRYTSCTSISSDQCYRHVVRPVGGRAHNIQSLQRQDDGTHE